MESVGYVSEMSRRDKASLFRAVRAKYRRNRKKNKGKQKKESLYRLTFEAYDRLGQGGSSADGDNDVRLLGLSVRRALVRGAHYPRRLRHGHETGPGRVACGGGARVGHQGAERVDQVVDPALAPQLVRENRAERRAWVFVRGFRTRDQGDSGWNPAHKACCVALIDGYCSVAKCPGG